MLRFVFGSKRDLGKGLAGIDRNYSLYTVCFPDSEERESRQKMKMLFLRIIGWNYLQMFKNDDLVGICQFCQVTQEAVFLEHLYFEPSLRRRGFGSALVQRVEAQFATLGVPWLLAEINDHNLMSPEEVAADNPHPVERYKFWVKMGYRGIDAPYRQPPLADLIPTAAECELLGRDSVEPDEVGAPGTVDYLALIGKAPGGRDDHGGGPRGSHRVLLRDVHSGRAGPAARTVLHRSARSPARGRGGAVDPARHTAHASPDARVNRRQVNKGDEGTAN